MDEYFDALMSVTTQHTILQEKWHTWSHGLGLLLIAIGGAYLLWWTCMQGQLPLIVGVSIYLVGGVFVYAASTMYHAVSPGQLKERLQQLDHISIYFMIAGSHMPIIMRYMNSQEGYIFLAILWLLVLIGTVFKIFWMGKFETLSLILYVVMGLLSFYLFPAFLDQMSTWILVLIITGGVLYCSGIVFYLWESLPWHHLIWHCFVLLGSIAHFIGIYGIATGK